MVLKCMCVFIPKVYLKLTDQVFHFNFQTPNDENSDFATLRFHAGPPYEVRNLLDGPFLGWISV